MATPEVSVVLPTFNRVAYLREAVDSVLAQTHADWELIIADDGSDAETRAFLHQLTDLRVTALLLSHSGNPAAVRNKAIQKARGKYLAFLDSDDVWVPEKLERQLELMRARRDRRWSYAKDVTIDGRGAPVFDARVSPWVPYEGSILEPLLRIDALVSTPSVIAERRLVDEAGGFDEEQHYAEDYDLWLRLAMRSEVSVSPEPLVRVRNHANNYSRDRVAAYLGWMRLYEKMAGLVPDSRLRALCHRRRGEAALVLAGLYSDRGDDAAVARTLLAASRHSWPYATWWWGATRTLARPIVPQRVLPMYRRWKTLAKRYATRDR